MFYLTFNCMFVFGATRKACSGFRNEFPRTAGEADSSDLAGAAEKFDHGTHRGDPDYRYVVNREL